MAGNLVMRPEPVDDTDDTGRLRGPLQRIYTDGTRWSMDPRVFRPSGPWTVPDDEDGEVAA